MAKVPQRNINLSRVLGTTAQLTGKLALNLLDSEVSHATLIGDVEGLLLDAHAAVRAYRLANEKTFVKGNQKL